MHLVQLEGFIDRYPSQLSGGQRQRMALARALAVEPKVLLLDEPFGALDAKVRKELRHWLRRLHDEVHVTTIFVTHDQEEAMDVAEQIVVMNDGLVEQTGPPRAIYEHPETEFVMSFIGPVNRLGAAFVRPHDVQILPAPSRAAEEAMIERIVHLGFEVRVEFTLANGNSLYAQITRAQAEELELEERQIVYVRPSTARVFEPASNGDIAGHRGARRRLAGPGMDPAALALWIFLALLIGWVGVILVATWLQVREETRAWSSATISRRSASGALGGSEDRRRPAAARRRPRRPA